MTLANTTEKLHKFNSYNDDNSQLSSAKLFYSAKAHSYSPKLAASVVDSDWDTIKRATYITKKIEVESYTHSNVLFINNSLSLNIPVAIKDLEKVFLQGKYILDLKDDWNDEGAIGYKLETWRSAAHFIINFNKWLVGIFSGSLHLPKMHHGPNGTIDIVWNEDNFRLFINIDSENNKGSFYSDSPTKQYSEGVFLLDNLKFNMLPLPFKY